MDDMTEKYIKKAIRRTRMSGLNRSPTFSFEEKFVAQELHRLGIYTSNKSFRELCYSVQLRYFRLARIIIQTVRDLDEEVLDPNVRVHYGGV